MLEIHFREAVLLKKLVETLKDISKEVNVVCKHEVLSLQTMDESHVALVNLQLAPDALLSYRCDVECTLGLDLIAMHKYISPFSNSLPLILRRNESEQVVTFVGSSAKAAAPAAQKKDAQSGDEDEDAIEDAADDDRDEENAGKREKLKDHDDRKASQSKNSWNRTASMKLIQVEREQYHTPEIEFQAEMSLPAILFSHVVKGNIGVSETLKLTAGSSTLELSVDGDLGHTSTIFHKGVGPLKNERLFPWKWVKSEQDPSNRRSHETVEIEVALSYLQRFIKAAAVSKRVRICLSPGIPLRLTFAVEEDFSSSSRLEFFLAPKVGDADEEGMEY